MRSGLGWIVVEFDEILIDWGAFRGLAPLDRLLEHYAPDYVAVPWHAARWAAVQRVEKYGFEVIFVSDEVLDSAFVGCGATTEPDRTAALANQFPEVRDQAPSFGAWKRETEREAIFNALAIAIAAGHA